MALNKRTLGFVCVLAGLVLAARANAAEIHDAALKGELDAVKQLIEHDPACVNSIGKGGKLPIHYAAQGGSRAVVDFLLRHGAKADALNEGDETPLHYAAAFDKREVAELLLANKADINRKARNGGSPLEYAFGFKHFDMAKWLLSKGADKIEKQPDGSTLAHRLAYRGLADAINILIDAGASIEAKNNDGARPIHWACISGQPDVVRLLTERGTDIKKPDKSGWTPLLLACSNGSRQIVEVLLEKGASANDSISGGRSALFIACDSDSLETVELLLKHGAKPNNSMSTGRSVLQEACSRGTTKIVESLIVAGAKVNSADREGMTPLMLAAKGGYGDIVDLLKSKGANADAKSKTGRTAADLALENGQHRIAAGLGMNMQAAPARKNLAADPLQKGQVQVVYLYHSGWVVRTQKHVLIFDYAKGVREPDESALSNGTINPEELKDKQVVAFVSHEHADHYSPSVFQWKNTMPQMRIVTGFAPQGQKDFTLIEPGQVLNFDGVEVMATSSSDSGVAFLVKVDSVSIYHAGDNTCKTETITGDFKAGLDWLVSKGGTADLVFLPISGCGLGNLAYVLSGNEYAIKALKPKEVFPMHAGDAVQQFADYAKNAKKKGIDVPVWAARRSGDSTIVTLP